MVECTGFQDELIREPVQELWKIFNGSGVGIILISPKGHRFHATLRFGFEESNNEAEYEALLAELRVVKELKEKAVQCYSYSQLVANQILGEYQARGIKMAAYLAKVKG